MDSKLRHEAFVSNNNGTTIAEINLVTLCSNISLFAYLLMSACLSGCVFLKGPTARFLLQFSLLILPSLFTTTLLSDHLIPFCILLLFIPIIPYTILSFSGGGLGDGGKDKNKSFADKATDTWPIASLANEGFKYILPSQFPKTHKNDNIKIIENTSMMKIRDEKDIPKKQKTFRNQAYRPSFLSNARAFVLVQTSISILAIDFPVYPRRFGKTETVGFGLMDAGVGLFIVCNSVVDPFIRRSFQGWRGWKNVVETFLTSLFSTWPLLLCFILRLVSLRGLDYQQHISEYGLHWNFFLTLAFLKVISSTINTIFSPKQNLILAIIISTVYEIYLESFNFRSYILLSGPRTNIIDMNKEGLFSMFGNYCLYVYSLELGRYIYSHHLKYGNTSISPHRLKTTLTIKLMSVSLCLWLSLYLCLWMGFDVSRRLANVGYVLWVLAICTMVLCLSLLVEVLVTWMLGRIKILTYLGFEPELLSSITHNSFFFFMLANLLTGLVNMSTDTINTKTTTALTIMVVYLVGLNGLFSVLYAYGVKLKFW